LGLTKAQGDVLLSVANQFKASEDSLRQSAYTAIGRGDRQSLTQIRAQRDALLSQSAIQLLETMDSAGANHLVERFAKDEAARPHISIPSPNKSGN
jgi:hypothetical protein